MRTVITTWYAPDQAVWGIIVPGFLMIPDYQPLRIAAGNVLASVAIIYLFQGFAVLTHLFDRIKLTGFLRTLTLVLVLLQPFLILFMWAVGFFDTWADFRARFKRLVERAHLLLDLDQGDLAQPAGAKHLHRFDVMGIAALLRAHHRDHARPPRPDAPAAGGGQGNVRCGGIGHLRGSRGSRRVCDRGVPERTDPALPGGVAAAGDAARARPGPSPSGAAASTLI